MKSSSLSLFDYKSKTPVEYTVSEISNLIKKTIEDGFDFVRVRGEVSGLKIAPSGHVYFSLKDQSAVIAAICWKGQFGALKHKPEDGMEVICNGSITTYQGQSKYQLIATSIEPAGMGALMMLLEKRKQQLFKEGLFDAKHKKPLPFLPQVIGVITSPTGAVIQDIIHRIEDRFPTRILLWPVLVQGENSAQQIAKALHGFNDIAVGSSIPRPDVIIVARGGGSIEDLWSFNEEIVVRAVFNSKIPVISAVGHETDTTLIDYVADVRAPTPTAAAEFAVPVRTALLQEIEVLHHRNRSAMEAIFHKFKTDVVAFVQGLPDINSIINNYTQRLDDSDIRLINGIKNYNLHISHILHGISANIQTPQHYIAQYKQNLQLTYNKFSMTVLKLYDERRHLITNIALSLNTSVFMQKIDTAIARAEDYWSRLEYGGVRALSGRMLEVSSIEKILESYSYKNTLKRGFALIRDKSNNLLTSIASMDGSREVVIEMHDGIKEATIK